MLRILRGSRFGYPGRMEDGEAAASGAEGERDQRKTVHDARSTEEVFGLFYAEIRRLAARYLSQEREGHTLQPTALVHEAYLRLLGDEEVVWESRAQFLSAAARAMRRYLVDHARGKLRDKRGGGWQRVDVTLQVEGEATLQLGLVDLDQALEELTQLFEREARVIELRYFAGLSVPQVAEILGVDPRTVERDWRHARAWLSSRLGEKEAP